LSLLARTYLQIPATSAPLERFFSQGARIINKDRNRLNKDTFEYIIALKSWGLYINKENKEEQEEEEGLRENNFEIVN
jgi:hypothetical protein